MPTDDQLLLQTPLFAGLTADTVRWLLADATASDHPDGGMLFSQGDVADRFFAVLAGHVNLFALTEAGAHSIIEVIEPGQTFAEAVMFMNGQFPLNAEVAPGTRLLTITAPPFLARLAQRPQLTLHLLTSMAHWQHRLIREIASLQGRSPAPRVGLFLLARLQAGGGNVRLPLTMTELASRIGITPESLSRIMARLRPLGVSSGRTEIEIADPQELRRFCQDDD